MLWLKYAYNLFFVCFVLADCWATYVAARRSRSVDLSGVPSHDGSSRSSDRLVFAATPSEIGVLRSAETTLTTRVRPEVRDVFGSMIVGGLVGYGAIWSFAVTDIWMAYSIVGISGFLTAYVAYRRAGRHCCSFVGTDGFSHTVARVYRNACSDDRLIVSSIPFDRVMDIYLRPDVNLIFICLEKDWRTPFKTGCFQRFPPDAVTAEDWNAFHAATKTAFEEHLWSRALLQLALSKLIAKKDPHVIPEAAFQAMLSANISESGFLPNEGLYQPDESNEFYWQVGCGTITFTLHSLVISSRHADVFRPNEGVHVEVRPEQVKRASIENDTLCIETESDGSFSVPIERCSKSSTLVRLIHSSIWTEGIEAQIEKEIQHDTDALQLAGWPDRYDEVPYWTVIPGHRYAIWHAAEVLKRSPLESRFASALKLQSGYKSGNPCYPFWLFYPDQFPGWFLYNAFQYETRRYKENREEYLDQLFGHAKKGTEQDE